MNNKSMTPRSRANSLSYAIAGLKQLFRSEPNARIHAAATLITIVSGIVQHISAIRWAILAIVIGLVWITEAINTCIELLCNFACDNKAHPAIKTIKDISAAAVLIAAAVSVAAGVYIFIF